MDCVLCQGLASLRGACRCPPQSEDGSRTTLARAPNTYIDGGGKENRCDRQLGREEVGRQRFFVEFYTLVSVQWRGQTNDPDFFFFS